MTQYAAGCDPSGGGADEFTWSIVHREGEKVIVDLIAARGRKGRHPFDLDGAVAACCADLATYGLRECLGDRYAGGWVPEAFLRYGIHYRYSAQNKSDLYLNLLPLLTRGIIELPDDPDLLKQLKLLQRRRGSQGKDVVDHPVGGRDDRANAIALAVAALGPRPLTEGGIEVLRAGGAPSWAELEARYGGMCGGWEESGKGLLERVDDGEFQGRRFDW